LLGDRGESGVEIPILNILTLWLGIPILFPCLKKKPYWGDHFWAKGYCVDTVGVDAEMIRKYVKFQEKIEKDLES